MNLDELQNKLLAAARAHTPADTVPYAFENRILAHLANQPVLDLSVVWLRGLWRAAVSCTALCVLLAAWTLFSSSTTSSGEEFRQQFENTVLAAVDQETQTAW